MANTKSAKKANRASIKKNEVNNSRKNRIRSFMRKVDFAIKEGSQDKAKEAFKTLEPELMRGVTKKVFKIKTASRILQKLSASIKKIKVA